MPKTATSAAQFLPDERTLPALREAAEHCRGCPLYQRATKTVFGRGARRARVFLVGEQPGHEEDLRGEPFVGPAGRVLDAGLAEAGIDRSTAYVTNVVKHFSWTPSGKRRLHKTPTAREIGACIPWLEQEIALVEPEVLVCLGATAARALLGREFRVSVQHGQPVQTHWAPHALATVHPSSILRAPTPQERELSMASFVRDLAVAAKLASGSARRPRRT